MMEIAVYIAYFHCKKKISVRLRKHISIISTLQFFALFREPGICERLTGKYYYSNTPAIKKQTQSSTEFRKDGVSK